MPNYIHTTRESFRQKVQQKLGEDGVHWPVTELNLSIDEALLTFGALSGFWKEEIFIQTAENKTIYNLFSDVNIGQEFIIPSIKYVDVFNWLNRDLIESLSFAQPIAEFLDLNTYIKIIESKYNEFQQLINLVLKVTEFEIPANQNIIALPLDLIDIIRISFMSDEFNEIILEDADEKEVSQNSSALDEFDVPLYYSNVYGSSKDLKVFPTPANVGTIKIIYTSAINPNVAIDANSIINLPNNLVPYIKFGVEADIFSNTGVLNDNVRAAYCNQRWQEGIMVGRNYTSVLLAKANGKNIDVDSLSNVDIYSDETKVRTPPTVLGFGGFNIFRTLEIPSAVNYSLGILTIANAKLPINDADFIRIDLEYIDTLADYVVHLAKFRNGANEVAVTSNLKDNFLKMSINHNRRLLQAGITFDDLIMTTKKQERDNPRIAVEA